MQAEEFDAMPPEEKLRSLSEISDMETERAEREARYLLIRLTLPGVEPLPFPSLYLDAERLVLMEAPYLEPNTLAELKKILPSLLNEARAYRRQERERIAADMESTEAQLARDDPPSSDRDEGAVAELALPREITWNDPAGYDDFLHDEDKPPFDHEENRSSGVKSRREAETPFFYRPGRLRRGAPYHDPRYPMIEVWNAHSSAIKHAARAYRRNPGAATQLRFWNRSQEAFKDFEKRVQEYMRLFKKIGRLGPAMNRHFERFYAQADELCANIQRVQLEYGIPDSFRDVQGEKILAPFAWQQGIFKLLQLQRKLAAAEYAWKEKARGASADARRLCLAARGIALSPLWTMMNYYRWIWDSAKRDQDTSNLKEIPRAIPIWRKNPSREASGLWSWDEWRYGERLSYRKELEQRGEKYLLGLNDASLLTLDQMRVILELSREQAIRPMPYGGPILLLMRVICTLGTISLLVACLAYPAAVPWLAAFTFGIPLASMIVLFPFALRDLLMHWRFYRLGKALDKLEKSLPGS